MKCPRENRVSAKNSTIKDRGKTIFSPLEFLLIRMRPNWDTPVAPKPAGKFLGKLTEGWESLPKSASQISYLWCLVSEGLKLLHCLFFFKFRSAGKKRKKKKLDLYTVTHEFPSCLSHLCPENVVWPPSGWGPKKYGQTEMWAAFYVHVGSYWLLPTLSGIVWAFSFFWLSLGTPLNLGILVPFTPSLGTSLASKRLFDTDRSIYYLPQLKPNKMFKIYIFLSNTMVRSWPIRSWYSEPDRNYFTIRPPAPPPHLP